MNLFICYTPFHIDLSYTLVNQLKLSNYKIITVNIKTEIKNNKTQQMFGNTVLISLKLLILVFRYRYIYIFTDRKKEIKMMLIFYLKYKKFIVVEDGIEAYLEFRRIKERKFLSKLNVNNVKLSHSYYGSSFPYYKFYILLPEFSRSNIQKKFEIDNGEYRKRVVNTSKSFKKYNTIITIPIEEPKNLLNKIDEILNRINELNSERLGLKLHPRQVLNNELLNKIKKSYKFDILNKNQPAEYFMPSYGEVKIYGSVSTFIYTSKIINNKREYYIIDSNKLPSTEILRISQLLKANSII